MKSLSSKTYQCGVTIQGLTTLSGTVYLTGITNTASWDHVIVGTTAQGQIYTRTYAQFMGDVATGISLSSYVTGSGTTNYLPKFTGASALGNSQIFDNGTNVGIGTSSPGAKLEVAGNGIGKVLIGDIGGYTNYAGISLNGSAAAGSYNILSRASDSTLLLNRPFGDIAFWENNATLQMVIKGTSGNIGIGTASPREKLQIVGNTVIGSAGLNSYKTNLYLTYNAGADETWVRIYLPQDYVSSNNGGTVRVRVLWEGDHATFAAYQEYQISYKTFYPASPYLKFSNVLCTNKTSDFSTGSTYYPPSSTPDVLFYDNTDGYLYVKVKGTHTGYNTARYIEAEIFGRTTAQPTIATTSAPGAPVELTKTIQFLPQEGNIYASGNVGIGTTSPSEKLHVIGNTILQATSTGNGTTAIRINNSVGTQVLAIGAAGEIIMDNSSKISTIVDPTSTQPQLELYNGGTGYTTLQSSTSYGLLLNPSGGNVGIGTTSPATKLDVNGSVLSSSGFFAGSIANSRFTVDPTAIYAYYSTEPNARVAIGRDVYYGGQAGIALGGQGTFAMIGDGSSTSGTVLAFAVGAGLSGGPSAEKMRITSTGNVGIGTTSPGALLDVNGTSIFNGTLQIKGNGTKINWYNAGYENWYAGTRTSTTQWSIGSASQADILTLNNAGTATFSNNLVTTNGIADPAYARITAPDGGISINNSPISAAIKIALPANGSFTNTMLSFTVHIFDYALGKTRTLKIAGYTYYNQDWYNMSVYQSGGELIGNINVRFGVEGGRNCVWIGETNTYWSYPNIFVTDVQCGHSQTANLTSGWSISLATTLGTVQGTLVAYTNITTKDIGGTTNYVSKFTGANTLGNSLIFDNGTNVGIGTTNPLTKLWIEGNDITLNTEGSSQAKTLYFRYSNGAAVNADSYLTFGTGGSPIERMRITSDGQFWFKGVSTSTGYEGAMSNTETTFDIYGSRYGGTGKALTFWATGAAESMRITAAGNVGIGTTSPTTKLDVNGVITATGGNSTNWNTAYGWGNHASAGYVPQARTLTINGTSYDLSANRTWTIATSGNIQQAADNGKVTTAASVGTTVITTVATASYDGATFNYVLKDGTNYRAGTIIAVWSAGAVQFNETTTNDIGSTVGVTFAVALNAGNAELRATSATSGWTVKVVTIGI